jgi:hypothetical protein
MNDNYFNKLNYSCTTSIHTYAHESLFEREVSGIGAIKKDNKSKLTVKLEHERMH